MKPRSKQAPKTTVEPWSAPKGESLVTFLQRKLAEAEEYAHLAAVGESWVAVARLQRETVTLRRELEVALEEESGPTDQMSDDDLVALIQRAIATVPEAHLEVIEDALAFRRGPARGAVVQ